MIQSSSGRTISLIITSYKQLHFLRDALASATAQTVPFSQIIVVEDGSGDETIPFLKEWAGMHDNAEIVFHDQNRGRSPARNNGLSHATGDYVAFLDGDDLLQPNACETFHALINEHAPDVLLYNMTYVQTDGDGVKPATPKNRMFSKGQGDGPSFPRHMNPPDEGDVARLFWSHPTAWQKLHRLEFLKDFSAQFQGPIYEDISWHFETLFRARAISYITDQLVQYRLHDKSALSASSENHMHIFDQYERIAKFIDGETPASQGLVASFRRFRFVHLSFVGVKTERLPEHLRQAYAQKVLAVPNLTAFDLGEEDHEVLRQLQILAGQTP